MNARQLFVRAGLLLLVAILGGCASEPPSVVPRDRDYHYDRRDYSYPSGLSRLEDSTTIVRLPSGGLGFFPNGAPSHLRDRVVAEPRLGVRNRSLANSRGLQRPMYLLEDLLEMQKEAREQLTKRCPGHKAEADDMLANVAGGAATGAVVGAVANGPLGAAAGAIAGGIAGATRAKDYGRYTCQQLIDELDFVRRQKFLLVAWQQEQKRLEQIETLDLFRRR